jgi:phage tail-like protein
MRSVIDDLVPAVPMGLLLPGVLQEDEFAQRFVAAFDVALAPVVASLDDLDAYVDPLLAPDDFVDWLAGWVGVEFADAWDLERRREIVANAVRTYRRDGTAAGIRAAVELATGGTVEIVETGGARWSASPGAELPGTPEAGMHVQVTVEDPTRVDVRRVNKLVASIKPAHVAHTVEVVGR